MSRYILLVSVVPPDKAELISNAAVAAGLWRWGAA